MAKTPWQHFPTSLISSKSFYTRDRGNVRALDWSAEVVSEKPRGAQEWRRNCSGRLKSPDQWRRLWKFNRDYLDSIGYGSIPLNSIFRGMNIHLPIFTSYFDVNYRGIQGYFSVLTHCQLTQLTQFAISISQGDDWIIIGLKIILKGHKNPGTWWLLVVMTAVIQIWSLAGHATPILWMDLFLNSSSDTHQTKTNSWYSSTVVSHNWHDFLYENRSISTYKSLIASKNYKSLMAI